ncbi:MAG: carboxypeptidase-like regulatory domain-containing protein [Bacteroidia bacterium]|nr:carboxypeptidase-like regulatory domain-containing protein [Bacteroidia bacterium]NNK73825.1 hypothetical protein [Flavobacteriaceae bacterium]
MKKFILLSFSLLPILLFGQYEITIKASVIDEVTREPIPFANVEFVNTSVTEITETDGSFKMIFDDYVISDNDTLLVSAFGYEPQDIHAKDFYKFLTNTNKIFLRHIPAGKSISPEKNNFHKSLFGTVTVNNIPVQGAVISVKDSFKEGRTDANGSFSIDAEKGDIVLVKYLGMIPQEIKVESVGRLDFKLKSDGELMEEVFLMGRYVEKPKIDLGYNGKKNYDEITYSAGVIGRKEIKTNYYQLSDLLNGRLAKTSYSRNGSLNLPSSYIYDIDGMIYTSENDLQLPLIDPQIIESIVVLNSLSATHKYGTLARNGVIVIRTKTTGYDKPDTEKPKALIEGNNYNESVRLAEGADRSDISQALKTASSFEEAKLIFLNSEKKDAQPGVTFYFDASDYFLRWDREYAIQLLDRIGQIGYENTKALRALAFKYEALEKFSAAKEVYQRIAIISPLDAQTYIDLARSYKNTGQYREAMDLLKNMLRNKKEGVDFTGLQNTIENEIQHILAFHRTKVDYYDLPNDLRSAKFNYDVRVLCEWNDPYAEFELQFVNPGKRYFSWRNSKLQNTQRMLDGIRNGYAMEEFIVDEAEAGEWIINLKATEHQLGINPTYFKYTVYTDYGLSTEQSETKVIQLSDQSEKVTIERLKFE